MSLLRARDWSDCIVWSRKLFDWCNQNWVVDVKQQYDAADPMWQGRAMPDVVPFDHCDELVQQFVGTAAVLKAVASGIQPQGTMEPNSTRFAAIAHAASSLEAAVLPEVEDKSLSHITHFEKDDDANFHVAFIAACANLKARMFHITPAICQPPLTPAPITITQLKLIIICSQFQSKGRGWWHHPCCRHLHQLRLRPHLHGCIQGRSAQAIARQHHVSWSPNEPRLCQVLFPDYAAPTSRQFENFICLWRVPGARSVLGFKSFFIVLFCSFFYSVWGRAVFSTFRLRLFFIVIPGGCADDACSGLNGTHASKRRAA